MFSSLRAHSGPHGAGARRRSLPRVPVYNPEEQLEESHSYNVEPHPDENDSPLWSPFSPPQNWGGANESAFNFAGVVPPTSVPMVNAPPPMDQFDEYLYKSTHIGQSSPHHAFPPEVNIEVPSDSDSSRRPSKYTISNASSMHDMVQIGMGDRDGNAQWEILQNFDAYFSKKIWRMEEFRKEIDRTKKWKKIDSAVEMAQLSVNRQD